MVTIHDTWIDLMNIQKSRRIVRKIYRKNKKKINESEVESFQGTADLLEVKLEKIKIADKVKKNRAADYQSDNSVTTDMAKDFWELESRLANYNTSKMELKSTTSVLRTLVEGEQIPNKTLTQTFNTLDKIEKFIQAEE